MAEQNVVFDHIAFDDDNGGSAPKLKVTNNGSTVATITITTSGVTLRVEVSGSTKTLYYTTGSALSGEALAVKFKRSEFTLDFDDYKMDNGSTVYCVAYVGGDDFRNGKNKAAPVNIEGYDASLNLTGTSSSHMELNAN